MAATRREVQLEPWHHHTHHFDDDNDDNCIPSSSDTGDVEAALLHALGPLSNVVNQPNVHLRPSTTTTRSGSSPSKKSSSPLRPIRTPRHHQLGEYRLSPPPQPHFTDSPQKDNSFYAMYHQIAPQPGRTLYPQRATPSAQDNAKAYVEDAAPGDATVTAAVVNHLTTPACPDADYGHKGPLKRAHTDDSLSAKQTAKKQKLGDEQAFDLPSPEDMPLIVDDGQKPPHSYAELIGMAILRASNRRLTLAQIYRWISDNFAFYRGSEAGWHNSIRHNLSLNKNFIKQERPKDDPGKGNYWVIKPGEERPFLQGKKQPIRKHFGSDCSSHTQQSLPMSSTSEAAAFRSSNMPASFSIGSTSARTIDARDIDSARFPDETELSSDATLPASDPALQQEDDRDEDAAAMPPPAAHMRSSPPPQDICSSPPTMPSNRNNGTPPPMPPSSRSAGRRRKFAGLHDSGYWSSLESSAARSAAHQLASESDIRSHRIKNGRAEAEIARIRSSSYDSPSKDQGRFGSSPLRKDDNPLTPAVVFKRPARPPPSISPNTNLRDHRDRVRALLGSPAKTFSSPNPEANLWSPAFNLSEEGPLGLTPFISPYKQSKTPWRPTADSPSMGYNLNNAAFDIFIDAPEDSHAARGSPEKRTRRRPSLGRVATSTGILADITGVKSNSLMLPHTSNSPLSPLPPMTKHEFSRPSGRAGSPLKQAHEPPTSARDTGWLNVGLGAENQPSSQSVSGHDVSKLFGVELHSDGSEEGIDIFQDFGKIGQSSQAMAAPDRSTGSPVRRSAMGPPARPIIGRSTTSRW